MMANSYLTLVKLNQVHEDLAELLGRHHPLTEKLCDAIGDMEDLFGEGVLGDEDL